QAARVRLLRRVGRRTRSVEQLRQVFTELQVVTTRRAVVLPNVWDLFDAEGRLIDQPGRRAPSPRCSTNCGGGPMPSSPREPPKRPPDLTLTDGCVAHRLPCRPARS